MTAPQLSPPAWEPLTPRGVATFAHATFGRLLLVQGIVAMLVAAASVWFLCDGWFPTVSEAIRQLPAAGEIRSGRLDWRDDSPRLLAEGRFLAFSVDKDHRGDIRSPAHVQIEIGRDSFVVYSLLGYLEFSYPMGRTFPFNRTDLEPWWGAWRPELLALAAVAVVVGLLLMWAGLATVYVLPVWLTGFFTNRDLNLRGSWRLAGAALMPGALVMAAAILAYDLGILDLVSLLLVAGAHFVCGWIYLAISPLFLPRHPTAARPQNNPFRSPRAGGRKPEAESRRPDS